MGKPTGFIEFDREPPHAREPHERIGDFAEFQLRLPEDKLTMQAARCMDCGIPFCHTGVVLNGAASGCPINNLIPEWNHLVYQGRWRDAYLRLSKTNNFPEFTGRVCPAPCEASCTLSVNREPVTIKKLEHEIIERAWSEGWVVPEPPAQRTGKRVAVVGSGPSGLAAAQQLNRAGHLVTVFERADRIGGLLMYGIPAMKLDKGVVERRVNLLRAEGITFVPNTTIGRDVPAGQLQSEYDAVVLAVGATRPRDLNVPGRGLAGIHFAMEYLSLNTKSLLDSNHRNGGYISAQDKDVLIIGGGDTGNDCVGSALRHGCRSVVQFEITPRPPAERTADNPWPEWPRTYRQDYGQEEASVIFGREPREFAIDTAEFLADDQGHVRSVRTVRVEMKREGNRLTFSPIAGSEEEWPAQLVLLAMGFLGPEPALLAQFGVAQDERSNVRTPRQGYATSVPGVFAAGDAHRGQSLVVWAINEGRAAAREVDRYLMGASVLP